MTVRLPGKALRPVPYFFSLCIHGVVVALLLLISQGLPEKTPSAYDQLIKGKESKIVFYKFKETLPDVQPLKTADSRPPKAEIKIAKQQIVSSPKNAVKGMQTVWQPVPDILPKEVPSPNILAMKAPPVPAPERKKFVPPTEMAKVEPVLTQPKVLEAPQPVVRASKLPDQLGAAPALTNANRMRFVAPEARASAATAAPASPQLEAAPQLSSQELNIAVVGLNPALTNAIPKGTRASEFSAGPVVRADGGSGAAGKGLTVPDLYVSGGGPSAKPTLMASLNAAPTSAEALRGMSKYAAPATESIAGAPAAPRSAATRVSSAPNSKFDGREVYTMAIQMPNITSFSGSWLMWYSGRSAGSGPIAPPIAHRKVDPKYIAEAAEARIEGKVQLLCIIGQTGHVDHVELVRGIDERLDRSAMEALAKWQFTPALRGGEPVDVDVMVEIPFHLAPRLPK